jgi:hypothetical protein
MNEANKRYLMHFGGAMLMYSVSVPASIFAINTMQATGWVSGTLSQIPMLPALYALHAFVARFRSMDEFQQRIISEGILWGAGIVGFASFGYGFLEGSTNAPAISMIWVLPALIASYGIASWVLIRRFN